MGVVVGFEGGALALVDEFLVEGLVDGDLARAVVAVEVGAGVADVDEVEGVGVSGSVSRCPVERGFGDADGGPRRW